MFSVPVCTYKSSWIIHRTGEKEGQTHTHLQTQRERVCVCMSVCYQLSRSHWLPRFWTKFSGFSGSPWLPSSNGFSSSATTRKGQNSPTKYCLQCSSFKNWVNFHPGCTAHQIMYIFYLNICFSQTYRIFCKHKGGKVVDKFIKFPFCNSKYLSLNEFMGEFSPIADIF